MNVVKYHALSCLVLGVRDKKARQPRIKIKRKEGPGYLALFWGLVHIPLVL